MVHSHDFYNQYQDTYIQYSAIYGPKVAVFLQKGAFYEFYGQQDMETGTHLNSFKEFTDILSCQVNIYEGDAPGNRTGFFAGVPDYTLDKWGGKLTGLGWTVVVITQDADGPTGAKKMTRSVSRILSPGTHVENVEIAAACYVGAYSTASGHAVVVDVTTGAITYSEYPEHAAHYFQIYPPRELVVYGPCPSVEDLQKKLYITSQTITYNKTELPPAYQRPAQRVTYLQDTFKPQTLLPFASWLGLIPPLQELLTALLLWIEDHYASLVTRLPRPTPWHPGDKIRIINNALLQLNINGPTQTTIEKLINTPYSAPGRRAIHAALATPYADPDRIRAKQREVAWISASPCRKQIVNDLKQLHDFPRIHRSIARGVIRAGGVLQLYQSLKIMRGLHDRMVCGVSGSDSDPFTNGRNTIGDGLDICIAVCDELFDQTKALKSQDAPQDWGFLKDAVAPQTAAVEQTIARIHTETAEWLRGLSIRTCASAELTFKPTDKCDYAVHMTKATLNAVQAYAKTLPKTDPYSACVFKTLSSGGRLEHSWLDAQQIKLDAQRANLRRTFDAELMRTCITYSDKTHEYTGALEDWVVHIDHAATYAATNEKYNWTIPTIEDSRESSGLNIKGLRHPLIEIQKTNIELVTHDIALDPGTSTSASASASASHGLLLYGINASGKSSLMKAVGIAVVLAQLGFGVPALSMTLRPYKKIASRILNQDNLWAGLSSFAVEMVELRELLTAADGHTLVLGDELCAGTESVSATAIVGASINALLEARSSFILATHLHDLNKISAVTDAVGLHIAHLKVHYDATRDILIYDRTLAPGPGSANYGLTVAKALHLPPAVLETAYTYRRLLTGDTHQNQPNTSYNASVLRKSCAACGCAITRDLEVHHIQEQAESINKTNADGSALHGLRNLVVVCRACHDAHHAGKLHIGPVRQTSVGPERIIENSPPKPSTTIGDLGEEDIGHIVEIAKNHPTLSTKLLLFQIKERHGLDVTSTQIATLRRKKII